MTRPAILHGAETWATTKKQQKTNWDKQDENATMDVRSDTQIQEQERRINESDAGCQTFHGTTIDLVRACVEER